jgi:hypothetical protein
MSRNAACIERTWLPGDAHARVMPDRLVNDGKGYAFPQASKLAAGVEACF